MDAVTVRAVMLMDQSLLSRHDWMRKSPVMKRKVALTALAGAGETANPVTVL